MVDPDNIFEEITKTLKKVDDLITSLEGRMVDAHSRGQVPSQSDASGYVSLLHAKLTGLTALSVLRTSTVDLPNWSDH